MSSELKQVKKGSVAEFREFYNNVIKKPLSSKDREELREAFKKKGEVDKESNGSKNILIPDSIRRS